MFEKVAEAKNESSNRRRFFRRLVGFAALAGFSGASLAGSTRKVYAADSENLIIGTANSGSSVTSLTASPSGDAAFKVETTSSSNNSEAIIGLASASTGLTYGVFGHSNSESGRGVYGYAGASTGTTYGVYGDSNSESGRGVYGSASASTGTTYGVYGEVWSRSGKGVYGGAIGSTGFTFGVYGQSSSVSGTGVYGGATASTGITYGVYGDSFSVSGTGLRGYASASTGFTFGVYGQSESVSGTGVYGGATASTGITYGVYGESGSVSGTGVYGGATASTGEGVGVLGESTSNNGYGVQGVARSTTGTTYGVWGDTLSSSGTAIYGYASAQTGTTYGVYGKSHSVNGISVIGHAGREGTKPIVARGYSGQTANLQEWQNSSATALSVIDKNGYLGIGTSSPVTALHLKSTSSNPAIRIENEGNHVGQFIYCYSSSGHIPFFSGRRARGTTASPTAVQTDDVLMRYGGSGYGTTAFPGGNKAILEFKAAEAWTDAAQGTYITFSTTSTGGTGTTERMRITAAGEIIPPTDNTGSIGTASKRWNLVRATTITPGDLVFENDYRITEDNQSGILLVNQKGERIARFDEQGNLHIKGKIIEGL